MIPIPIKTKTTRTTKSLKEIWRSERYRKVLRLIASDDFDARHMCGTLCLQHKVNEFLWDLKHRAVRMDTPLGKPPKHINFI